VGNIDGPPLPRFSGAAELVAKGAVVGGAAGVLARGSGAGRLGLASLEGSCKKYLTTVEQNGVGPLGSPEIQLSPSWLTSL
jgi:hypothetical protein